MDNGGYYSGTPTKIEFSFSEQWRQFVRLLETRLWTILTFLTVTVVVVVVGTSLQTPVYRATASVLIEMETPTVLAVSTTRDDSTVGQTNYLTYADYYRTQLEILKSRRLAKTVFSNLSLSEQLQYAGSKDAIGRLLDQIKIEPVKQTRLAKIHVEDSSPEQAAAIANELAYALVEENLSKSTMTEALTLMKNEYLKLQSKEAELSKRYKAKFPARVRVREQMAELTQTIERRIEMQNRIQTPSELTPDERQAIREGRTPKSSAKNIEEENMIGGLRPNNIRVQDLATPPVKRSKPNALLNFVIGIFLGLFGGIALAMIEDTWDGTVKTPADIESDPRFVFLGFVPHISVDGTNSAANPGNFYRHMALGLTTPTSEAFRVIRTNLIYAAPQTETRVVVITSPGSGEGKTTTVSNLAIALSQIGLKIILIDADMRKPKIHTAFEIPQTPGLSEYLVEKNTLNDVIHPTNIEGLSIIAAGACPPNPAELLGLPRMQQMIKDLSIKFDRVLIDAPPVIPVTDAVVLAAMTRTVLAVAHSGKTPRQALNRLHLAFDGVRAKVLGIILNNVAGYGVPSYGYGNELYAYGAETEQAKLHPAIGGLKKWLKGLDRSQAEKSPPSKTIKRSSTKDALKQ